MFRKLCYQLGIAFLFGALLMPSYAVHTASGEDWGDDASLIADLQQEVPQGFEPLLTEPGVILYRKNYPNGTPDFVQVIFLNQGATIRLLHGQVDQERPGRGVFGGNDARFNLDSLKGYWAFMQAHSENPFCVVNGSFFYMEETPTRLPFSLKVDGKILTDGYGQSQYAGQTLMLELWSDHADIQPLSGSNFYQSEAPNIIAGLTAEANKRAKYAVGRTFIGLQDRDDDGELETMMILSTQTHTQEGAARTLEDFGAQKVMMLDGGGSAQLACLGEEYIATGRLIPQAIGVFSAEPDGLSAQLVEAPTRLTAGSEEVVKQDWVLENSGELSWMPEEHRLIVEAGKYWEEQQFSPQESVLPGAQMQFSWSFLAPPEPGTYAYSLRWYISGAGRRSEIQELNQEITINAENQGVQSSSVGETTQASPVSSAAAQSVKDRLNKETSGQGDVNMPADQISLRDLLLVPAIVIPLGILLFWFFTWLRILAS